MADDVRVLIVPGLRDSGPAHWQSHWEARHPEFRRVVQDDWTSPHLADWTAKLDQAVRSARGRAFLVAHSFGCLAALKRIQARSLDLAGALLVAPADPHRFERATEGLRIAPLSVPAVLVASRNDPWLHFERAREITDRLACGFVDLGMAGHVNVASGFGPWPAGERLLESLLPAPAPLRQAA